MRVIFLDVDGVLNHSGCPEWQSGDHRVLDPECVRRVREICDRTGARIVVSSTWRLSSHGMEPLLAAFGERIIGVTPCGIKRGTLYEAVPRSLEIEAWVTQHASIPLETVVVDDDDDAATFPLTFIQTGFESGGLNAERAAALENAFAGVGAPQTTQGEKT